MAARLDLVQELERRARVVGRLGGRVDRLQVAAGVLEAPASFALRVTSAIYLIAALTDARSGVSS